MFCDEKQALKVSHGIKTKQKQQKAKAVAPTCVTMATTYTLHCVSIQTAPLLKWSCVGFQYLQLNIPITQCFHRFLMNGKDVFVCCLTLKRTLGLFERGMFVLCVCSVGKINILMFPRSYYFAEWRLHSLQTQKSWTLFWFHSVPYTWTWLVFCFVSSALGW